MSVVLSETPGVEEILDNKKCLASYRPMKDMVIGVFWLERNMA